MSSEVSKSRIDQEVYKPPPSYDRPARNEERYFRCCLRLTGSVLQKVLLIIAFCPETEKDSLTLSECLSNKETKRFIHNPNRQVEDSEKLKGKVENCTDPPFLKRVITSKTKATNRIKKIAKILCLKRNLVCHQGYLADDHQLKDEFAKILDQYEKILKAAMAIQSYDESQIQNLVSQYRCRMQESFTIPANTPIDSDLEAFQNSSFGKMIVRSRKHSMPPLEEESSTESSESDFDCYSNEFQSLKESEEVREMFNHFMDDTRDDSPVIIAWCLDNQKIKDILQYIQREWEIQSPAISSLNSFDLTISIDDIYSDTMHLSNYSNGVISFDDENQTEFLREMKILFLLSDLRPLSQALKELLETFPDAYMIVASSPEDTEAFQTLASNCERQTYLVQVQ